MFVMVMVQSNVVMVGRGWNIQALYGQVASYRDVLYTARDMPAHAEEAGEDERAAPDPTQTRDDVMDAYLLHVLQVSTCARCTLAACARALYPEGSLS